MTSPISLQLIESVACGDLQAWHELQVLAAPRIEAWARNHRDMRARGLHQGSGDHVRNVLVDALERLSRKKFRNLQTFLDSAKARVRPAFEPWLRILVDYTVQDYLRRIYGPAPVKQAEPREEQPVFGEAGASRRDVNTLAERIQNDDPLLYPLSSITLKLTAQEIMRRVQTTFTPEEFECLRLYIADGLDYAQLAASLNLPSAAKAEELVRALKERLRVMFREQT